MREADLGGTTLTRANLSEADLRGIDLRNSDLREADLTNAVMDVPLDNYHTRHSGLEVTDLFALKTSRDDSIEREYSYSRHRKRWATQLSFSRYGGHRTRLGLCETNLGGADLRQAVLRSAKMARADLSDSDLRGADLRETDLRKANLKGADMTDADLSDAKLPGAEYNVHTSWPEGFDPKAVEAVLVDE